MNFKNRFGEISDDFVRISSRNYSGEISLEHIFSLAIRHKNNQGIAVTAFSALAAILAYGFFFHVSMLTAIYLSAFGFLMLIIGFAFQAGHHVIEIRSMGEPVPPLIIPFANRKQGLAFFEALQEAVNGR